ncbi:MAG: type I phosphomannose isomerase catalytic subunit [Breznakia sp.]
MKKIVKIAPFYEARMWGGGKRLVKEFHYASDVQPLGEVYNVVALKGHADCDVLEMKMTLSALYEKYPEWFVCDTKELPIRVNILDPKMDLSIQVHPDDTFAKEYNNGRGKPEAWVILDTTENGRIQFGHNAKSKEEFIKRTEDKEWDTLLRYLKAEKNGFIDIPAGTLHAIGSGVLTYNISRNADVTLRLYDYDRIDPTTGKKRDIQPKEVYDNVNIPDRSTKFVHYPVVLEHGIQVTRYWDQKGLYTLMRLQIKKRGRFLHDRFAFYTCVDGSGLINNVIIRKGETVLVPHGMGCLEIEGNLDLFLASYRNEERGD